jgi:fatty acid desaturase
MGSPKDAETDVLAHRLLSDLHTPRPGLFWADLLCSATIGWVGFALAVVTTPFSFSMFAASLIASLALYRGLCFTHELVHLQRRSLPGFETAWNLLLGVPMLLPSFTYLGVHQSHHNLATYGTKDDPEYLPFASSRLLIFAFALLSSLVLPVLLLLRFLVLAPIGLILPRFHRELEVHASSFALNPAYRRLPSTATMQKMRRWEAATLAVWAVAIALTVFHVLPTRAILVWYAVVASISFVNALRVLGAHAYVSDGVPRDRAGQLRDSIDTPGGPWTELWAPVGLRYHALHHYFPGIPYHHLGTAYRRLVQALPPESTYRESTSPRLPSSLKTLYLRAARTRRSARGDHNLASVEAFRQPGS